MRCKQVFLNIKGEKLKTVNFYKQTLKIQDAKSVTYKFEISLIV